MNHLDDTTSQAVEGLLRALGCLQQHARRRLLHEHAKSSGSRRMAKIERTRKAYIFLLFKNMTNLEPDVCMSQRAGRTPQDAIETSKRLVILSLLFVDDS